MSVRKQGRAPLARAITLGLFALFGAPHAFAQQLVVTSGNHDATGNTYSTTGNDQPAISASNTDTSIIGENITATTTGTGSRGIEVLSNAVIELDNVGITTSGIGGVGIYADTDGNVSLANSRITTSGATAWGVHNATGGGVVTLTNSEINSDSRGVMAEGGTTDLSDTNIISAQEAIRALNAGTQVSVQGGRLESTAGTTNSVDVRSGASVSLAGTTVVGSILGTGAGTSVNLGSGTTVSSGVSVDSGATMIADGVAFGSSSRGVHAMGAGFQITDSSISNAIRGIELNDWDDIGITTGTLTNTTVDASTNAVVFTQSSGSTTGATLSVDSGALRSTTGATILVNAGAHHLNLSNGAQLSSGTGVLIDLPGNGVLTANLDGVELTGNTRASPIGDLDIAFRNGATLTGAMQNSRMVDLAAGTTWYVTAESDVESVLHTGTIQFTELATGQPFRTLTVHRDYTGFDGLLVLNTVLEDDHRYTDLLHVEGHTSGNTRLRILNMGGAGVQTAAEGIRVVQVDGESLGTFALDGRVVAGAYDYNLFQGGIGDDQDDGDWYLRSALTQEPGGPGDPGDPGDPGGPGGPGTGDGLFRPEVGAYLGNQAATLTMFRHHRGDRVADQYTGDDVEPRSVWLRGHQHHLDTRVAHDQISSGTDTRTTELGAELMHWTLDKVNLAVGAIYSEGSADSTETSALSGYTAKGSLDGRAFTLFGTWSTHPGGRTGWYLDQWLQYADFEHTVQGQDLAPERFGSKRTTASVEGGYGFLLHQSERYDLVLLPQLQIVYSDFEMPVYVEANGTVVQPEHPGGWSARAGVRLMGTINRVLRPYVEVNTWDDARAVEMQFDDAVVSMAPTGRVNEYNAGLSVGGKAWSGWASLGVQNGDAGLRAAQGQLGVRYRW